MATINMALSDKSIKNAVNSLEKYKQSILKRCEQLVSELADDGIAIAETNVGNFGRYITFTKQIEPESNGCTAIVLATETGQIKSQWLTSDGIKSADVSPLLMAEFGSGWRAQNPLNVPNVGQGTFPGQTHAFDKEGWYWRDLNGDLHHSYGITPTMPIYKAYVNTEQNILRKAREVFDGKSKSMGI